MAFPVLWTMPRSAAASRARSCSWRRTTWQALPLLAVLHFRCALTLDRLMTESSESLMILKIESVCLSSMTIDEVMHVHTISARGVNMLVRHDSQAR